MNFDIFTNTVGFIGNTSYSLKYMTHTRNLRCTWPHNNILAQSKDADSLLQSVFRQPVGIDRRHAYRDKSFELELILSQFLTKHRRTNYAKLLKRCNPQFQESKKNLHQPVPRYVVKEFIHRLVHNVIPLSLFGNEIERQVFEQNLRKILYLGKGQVFSLNMLMHRVRTKNKGYLKLLNGNIDKTNLLAKLYTWLLRCYIFAALKCVFYVTDSNPSKKYSFYEKRTWQRIQERAFNRMKKQVLDTYKNCLITRVVNSYNLYVLRILPKRRGSRPIYIKWKKELQKRKLQAPPLVQVVKHFFSQLAEENFMYAQNINASNFHQKWEDLYFCWASSGKPPVYFVKADFMDAYGSILHTKLLKSISELINKNQHKKEIVFQHRKRTVRVPIQHIVDIIENYVINFTYKHNENVYRLTEGISQGGPLSSLLCNFYFGEMDLKYLSEFGGDDSGFLVRNCDDYLYVTLDLIRALKFLNCLTDGFPDYNLKLNSSKTVTNIFLKSGKGNFVRISSYELDVNSFQLYRCFEPYKNSSIFHASFFRTIKYPGQILAKRVVLWALSKLDQVYFDTLYNTVHTILYNVFQTATLTAARFISYVRVLFRHYNQSFILRCILCSTVRIAFSVSKKVSFCDNVSNALLMWIVLKAFFVRLQRTENRNRYATVLRRINLTLSTWLTKFNSTEIQVLETLCSDERIRSLRFII